MRKWRLKVNKQLAEGLLMPTPIPFHLISHPLKKDRVCNAHDIDRPGPFIQNTKAWILLVSDFLILSTLALSSQLPAPNPYPGSETPSKGNTQLLLLNSSQASIFKNHAMLLHFAMLFCHYQSFFQSTSVSSAHATGRKTHARCRGDANADKIPILQELRSTEVDWLIQE